MLRDELCKLAQQNPQLLLDEEEYKKEKQSLFDHLRNIATTGKICCEIVNFQKEYPQLFKKCSEFINELSAEGFSSTKIIGNKNTGEYILYLNW